MPAPVKPDKSRLRPEWARSLPAEFDEWVEPDGSYKPRAVWPASTYAAWYPAPFPAVNQNPRDVGRSVAERLADPGKP